MDINEINVLVLAYFGDSIYENYVRKFLIKKGIANVNDLQKEAVHYVSGIRQCTYVKFMMDNRFLNEDECRIVLRARNNKSKAHPKNCDIITYKYATGLEALIGFLGLQNNFKRIDQIMNYILEVAEC